MEKITYGAAFEVLERLKSYTEFETVSVAPDGSVTVKYAQRSTVDEKTKKSPKPVITAIDSLGKPHPIFPVEKS